MYCTLQEAVEDFRAGKFLILVDALDRENEGDLILPAVFATPEAINFMVREACGLLHLAMTEDRLARIGIPMIEPRHATETTPRFGAPFDLRHGISTGISTRDRAETIRRAVAPDAGPDDFVIPGHVLPLASHPDGLLGRQGHTEGSVELARLAGLFPAVVMCEVLAPDGEMSRGETLRRFADQRGIRLISIERIQEAVGAVHA